MGSPLGTPYSRASERPARNVTVIGFYMGRHPVTQGGVGMELAWPVSQRGTDRSGRRALGGSPRGTRRWLG